MTTRVALLLLLLAATAFQPASTHDWTRFGFDAARSNSSSAPTGITPANVRTMRRQQVEIGGTVDASAIYLHAVADGRTEWSTTITLLPRREKIASPLNYFRGHVIAATGGYLGDASPYQGHVAIIDAASGRLLHVWNSLCSDRASLIEPSTCRESGSAIWGRAGAVIDTTTGNIFVATGNGLWDGRSNWGDAVIELDPDATRMTGNYTPTNTEQLDHSDADLGSTSPVLLGEFVAQSGKDGLLRLLDWKTMRGPAPHRGGEVESVRTPSGAGLFTAPAVWHSATATWIFVADGRIALPEGSSNRHRTSGTLDIWRLQ